MKSKVIKATLAGLILTLSSIANAGLIQFESSNILNISDFSTNFSPISQTSGNPPNLVIDGFNINQINGDGSDIWATYNPGGQGNGNGWYPSGGDFGYTLISLTNGLDFDSVSMFVGSGNGGHSYMAFDLLLDNVLVQSTVLSGHQSNFHWLSFTGGGFDTIRLRDGSSSTLSVLDGSHNALAFDSIHATVASEVPEPSTLAIFALGMIGLASRRFKKQ